MRVHPAFTPSAVSAAQLEAVTVGREALFATLVQRIVGAARDGARPHTLLVAPRGAGKTHTLHLVTNRAGEARGLADRLLPVLVPEDALGIGNYADLLVEISRQMSPDLTGPASRMRRERDLVGMEQAIIATAGSRMILLAIENLDRVFDDLGQAGQGSLRAWVESSTQIMVFATTPVLFAGVSSRSYPWYGSFMVESLPDLSVHEGATMLGRAAHRCGDDQLRAFIETDAGMERMQVIHRLAGGSPRLWHVLSECIDVNSLDALVPAVESLLDRLAPYYQQRLWQLPPGEQRLVVELARGWESRTVTDLASVVGISNQSAAAALGRLTKSRWTRPAKAPVGDKRATWYDLTEPLLRYQLQYREERGRPLRLVVEFLKGFYSHDRLVGELAGAAPGSHVERHLQQALYEPDGMFMDSVAREPRILIANLRLWMGNERGSFKDVAVALEAILVAAQGRSPEREVPSDIAAVVADAIAAQSDLEHLWERVKASMTVLRRHDWGNDADDALCVFEFVCSASGDGPTYTLDSDCAALRERHTSPPALLLRELRASAFLRDDQPDQAVEFLGEALDDIDGEPGVSTRDQTFLWSLFFQAILSATNTFARRQGRVFAGWVLLCSIQLGYCRPQDFDRVMAAFTEDTRGVVAAVVAMGAPMVGTELPSEVDPRRYIDDELLGAVDRLVADHRHETAVRSTISRES